MKARVNYDVLFGALICGGSLLLTAFGYYWRRRVKPLVPRRVVVLNPVDETSYSRSVMQMLRELFVAAGVSVDLSEVNIREDGNLASLDFSNYDGVIIPGSKYAAYDDFAWVTELKSIIRTLHATRVPMLGICFGHQIIAEALGGDGSVVLNSEHGCQAGACFFRATTNGKTLLELPDCDVALLYHHNDVVKRIPEDAVCLGRSAENPYHAVAYNECHTSGRPSIITFQAHPEFSTTTGKEVLKHIILSRDKPKFGSEWASDRVGSIGMEGKSWSLITRRCWDLLFTGGPY